MILEADAVVERAAKLRAGGVPFVLATVVRCESPTSAKPGAKAIVEADGIIQGWIGGGCAQPAVTKMAKKALLDGQSRLIRISPNRGNGKDEPVEEGVMDFGMTCHSGGTLDIFIDPVISRPSLLIIGGSPSAQTLSALAGRTGFAVTAAFPGADADMFPDAVKIIDGLDKDGLKDIRPSFVIVATQGKRDEEGLEAALNSGAPWISFIASERKAGKLKTYLRERGHDEARIETIISPAGIEIGAVTPEEIALSVAAGLVQARRSGVAAENTTASKTEPLASESAGSCCGGADTTPTTDKTGKTSGCDPATETAPEIVSATEPAEATDPICGMSVDRISAEYTSEYQGRTYYFCCGGCQHRFEQQPEKYLQEAV